MSRYSLSVLCVASLALLAPRSASAQVDEEPGDAVAHDVYVRAQISGGYWHYVQSRYADREVGSGLVALAGSFGLPVAPGVVLGTHAAFQLTLPGTGRRASGRELEAPFGGGFAWGLLFAYLPDEEEPPISLEVAAGFAMAGAPGAWGGGGPFASASLTVFFAHLGRSHVGAQLGVQYTSQYSDDATPRGAEKHFVAVTAGVGWTLY